MQNENDRNPWLSIPASDYEAHMGDSGARQLTFLGDAFKTVLDTYEPRRVAVLGCATGNGFEHVRPDDTELLVGIDINPEYVDVARSRFQDEIPNMQLFCSDITNIELEPRSMDLVWCGLFFEHVDPKLVVAKVFRWMRQGGVLGTVLQLQPESGSSVSDTGIESMKQLEPVSQLIEPKVLTDIAQSAGFLEEVAKTVTLDTGQSFRLLTYRLVS